jgi:hypothetical protein
MLWWLIGLWVCSPVVAPILWLLGRWGERQTSSLEDTSPAARSRDVAPGD